MRLRLIAILLLLLCVCSNLFAGIYPQAGIETYIGSNKLFIYTPWIGLRVGLSNNASLLLKYYNHNISFNYVNDELEKKKRTAHLSNFTTALYVQKWGHDFYSALSYFLGSDSHRALAFDSGASLKITKWLFFEAGVYLLNEKSILWYPDEEVRNIFLYSVKGGVKFKINKWISIQPRIYLYRNSEDVDAFTYSIGLNITPKDPFYINLSYFKYSESAQYRFSGDYLSVGLHFYY